MPDSDLIDVHAHALHPELLTELARDGAFGIAPRPGGFGFGGYGALDPLLHDVPARLARLDALGIALQVIAPPPRIVSTADWAADTAFAARLNRQTARLVAESGGRFCGLAVPPLSEPEAAVAEVTRAMDEDGLAGVSLPTSAAGAPLDSGAFEALFRLCAERRCLVFMHPTSGVDRPALGEYTMLQLVGWPSETSLCVARLIFAGVFERHPDLRLVLAHGGGTLPFLAGRLDLGYDAPHYEANPACRAHITRRPSSYLRNIWFDTVVSSPVTLRFLIDVVGVDRVLFGSDAPFEVGDAEGAIALPVIDGLPAADAAAIRGGTARALLTP